MTSAPSLNRSRRREVAEETLAALKQGSYLTYNISSQVAFSKDNTQYYPPDGELSNWPHATLYHSPQPTKIQLLEKSTLEGAHLLHELVASEVPQPRVGILNFASAKNPGGGFLGGSRAQEESIARSSSLYLSLTTPIAEPYYKNHKCNPHGGYYSHAMIYSPRVIIIRDDEGGWIEPLEVDVVTSPAVNAGVVRKSTKVTSEAIEDTMRERMGRLLYLFERNGIRNIVLGSFGTGAFRNEVGMVVRIWSDLILEEAGRYHRAFDNIVFAVLGHETFEKFREVFADKGVS
ncbi:hypothetical protein QCA50_005404 [Cerrena zonata]|uniref:Microbial-type PARG catalytic domain-containing protein n=1 Tax=Cerrena zonata TaxID=2478898 RepID=A0AAW0GLH2_9APHY